MNFRVIITTEKKELERAFAIRRKVFIEEQNVPAELELDEYDFHIETKHVLLINDVGHAVGTARFRPYGEGILKVERVSVMPEQRGSGAGRMIMQAIEGEAHKVGCNCMKLAAQIQARKFYEGLGYQACSDVYREAGIEHVDMLKKI